jgi:hypothetical protein
MSGLDGLRLDADGYIDMDQFPDDGTDLAGPELDQLREVLHADPVEEPTAEQWDAMFDDVVAGDVTGPFAVDDVEGLTADAGDLAGDEPFGATDGADDVLGEGDLPDADDLAADDLDLDGTVDDLDLDVDVDAGLDLAPTSDGVEDPFSVDGLDDAPADIANNDFEDLL